MKLVVNYDLLNSAKNVNEKLGPMKLVRNRVGHWAKFDFPFYLTIDLCINKPKNIPFIFVLQSLLLMTIETIQFRHDPFKEKSIRDLGNLAVSLQSLGVDTNYDLLTKTEMDGREYHVHLNEKKLPILVEKKYLLVPSYDYNGDVKFTDMEQEHVVGSKKYVLSLGSKRKNEARQFANANI